jgi:hypothetical protein
VLCLALTASKEHTEPATVNAGQQFNASSEADFAIMLATTSVSSLIGRLDG